MVSVAIATYNGELFFREQLESIVKQTVMPDEIVIRDDRSSDRTIEIANEFKNKYSSIKWDIRVNETNRGFVKNFLGAISQCKGDIIILCDQDDVWKNNKVEKTTAFFEDPEVVSMHGDIDIIDDKGEIIKRKVLGYEDLKSKMSAKKFVSNLYYCGMSSAFRKSLIPRITELDVETIPIHDWLVHALALCDDGFFTSAEVLVDRRYHENNVALNLSKNKREGLQQRIDVVSYYCDHYSLLDDLYKKYGRNREIGQYIANVNYTNKKRMEYLKNDSLAEALANAGKLMYYPTLKAYVSDLLYLIGLF